MQRIKDLELEPTEWKVDPKTGQRYRDVGKMREYEPTIVIDGIEIPQSQLSDFHRRRKEAEERRKAEALEAAKNRPEPKSCPFITNGCSTACKRENCNIFLKGKCSIATIADASGVEIEEAPAKAANALLAFTAAARAAHCITKAAPL